MSGAEGLVLCALVAWLAWRAWQGWTGRGQREHSAVVALAEYDAAVLARSIPECRAHPNAGRRGHSMTRVPSAGEVSAANARARVVFGEAPPSLAASAAADRLARAAWLARRARFMETYLKGKS